MQQASYPFKTILLIAPGRSYRIASYQSAAAGLGYRLILVSDTPHSLVHSIASGIHVDFQNTDTAFARVISEISVENIDAVLATDDRCVELAAKLAQHLGLPHNSAESARLTYRKDLARKQLQSCGCNTPWFQVVQLTQADDLTETLPYPVVVKPLMLSGSRGVIRANNSSEFIEAIKQLETILQKEAEEQGMQGFEYQHVLVESFLDGIEVAVDAFIQNGKLIPLALFDKPEPLCGPYFEESYYLTPSSHSDLIQQEIFDEVQRCCLAYGLQHGPIHAEARITPQGIYLIEMASRSIGGQCARLIEYSLDQNLEQLILQYLSGGKNQTIQANNAASGALMIPIKDSGVLQRVEGLLEASAVPGIEDIEIHIQLGYELVPLPQGSSYLGFIFARANTADECFQALKQAFEKLRFITKPTWKLTAL